MDGTEDDDVYQHEESDPPKDYSNAEVEEDDTSNIDSDGEFLASYDA